MTVQGLAARVPAQVGVWDEARVEAGWAVRLPQGRAEVVSVRNAEHELPMLRGSPAMKKTVENVEAK